MASLDSSIRLANIVRPCLAMGKRALFHTWVEVSTVHRAVSRSDVTGIMTDVYGLCEFEDGTVKKIKVSDIKFLDKPMRGYVYDQP